MGETEKSVDGSNNKTVFFFKHRIYEEKKFIISVGQFRRHFQFTEKSCRTSSLAIGLMTSRYLNNCPPTAFSNHQFNIHSIIMCVGSFWFYFIVWIFQNKILPTTCIFYVVLYCCCIADCCIASNHAAFKCQRSNHLLLRVICSFSLWLIIVLLSTRNSSKYYIMKCLTVHAH